LPLAKLRASSVQAWRSRLAGDGHVIEAGKPIAKATVNRLMNDLRAALNASAEAHRRELPPHLPAEIKIGTRAERVEGQARKQLLSDVMVRAAVDAAFEVEEDGHFGRLVMMAAATGARYSQLAALQVGHVQIAQARVMMRGSKKGRAGSAKAPVAVPLSSDVLERLAPALQRDPSAPLLVRWAYKNVGPLKWEKDQLRPLGAAYEIEKQWAGVVERAELPPGSIMYALRHTSIVRGLRAGLPVRLVASLHDTSTEMIEQHYSAFIVDMTEDLARRAMLSL
jgi:integrase